MTNEDIEWLKEELQEGKMLAYMFISVMEEGRLLKRHLPYKRRAEIFIKRVREFTDAKATGGE